MTGIFAIVTFGLCFGLAKAFAIDHSKLKTCAVCGFVTLPELGAPCQICQVGLNEENASKDGYASFSEYLIAAQTMYFMPTSPDTSIDFFAPCDCDAGYAKDANWKPTVSKKDILDVQDLVKEH